MAEVLQTNQARKPRPLQAILLFLAVLTSPLLCCGAFQLLDVLPGSFLPGVMDFAVNLFEAEARVENRTAETLYLTAITTTYDEPMIIAQTDSFRERDIPLAPHGSVVLKYDSADMTLAGIAVCRTAEDCRFMAVDSSGMYYLESYESLPSLEASWLSAIQSRPLYNYGQILILVLSLLPILLFAAWLYLGRMEKKRAG